MMVLTNAFKSISRAKGRNILIGVIVFTIAVASCIALSIRSAASEAESSGMDQIHITATITANRQKIMENAQNSGSMGQNGPPDMGGMREMMQEFSGLSLIEMQTYAQSQYVNSFYYSASASLSASGELEPVSTEESSSSDNQTFQVPGGMGGFGGENRGGKFGGMIMGDFSLTGYSAESAMTSFVNGDSKVTEGAVFDVAANDMQCLISSELAIFNGLSVGDTITLCNPNKEEETYSLTISGIYSNTESADTMGGMRFSTAMDPANAIYVSYLSLKQIAETSESIATTTTNGMGMETTTAVPLQTSGVYDFASKEDYENFCEDVYAMGLSENYTVSSTDVNNYEASLIPLKNLNCFATTMLLVVLVVGGIILVVLNIFNIRERKYEVGVLTAIGIKKGKVALQFMVELLAVTLIAVMIGAAVGAVASVPVSNSLLQSQVSSQQEQQNSEEQNFGREGIEIMEKPGGQPIQMFGGAQTASQYLSQINASANPTVLLQLIGIGLILTVISSLAGVIFVLRYEPLKILANRT